METPKGKTPLPQTGSIKNKIVAQDLLEERSHKNFDQEELTVALFGGKEELTDFREHIALMESDPILRNTEKWYDMTREEQMHDHF